MLYDDGKTVRMRWGKYRGRRPEDVPTDYLHWVSEEWDDRRMTDEENEAVRVVAESILDRRDLEKSHFYEGDEIAPRPRVWRPTKKKKRRLPKLGIVNQNDKEDIH